MTDQAIVENTSSKSNIDRRNNKKRRRCEERRTGASSFKQKIMEPIDSRIKGYRRKGKERKGGLIKPLTM